MIYFDNSATTKTYDEVAKYVADCSLNMFFNPSSVYAPSIKVKNSLNEARAKMLKILSASSNDNLYFTGSATEANNIILNGLARKNKKILVSIGEHPSVFETAKNLKNSGFDVQFVNLTKDGTLDTQHLLELLDDKVGLVSFIHVSNETGAINDIEGISKLIKQKVPTCLIHCDGVQAFCKVPVNLSNTLVDAYTISSHKVHGPKGVGAFYLRHGVNLKPSVFGGGQEFNVRPGTENVPGILGFVMASEIMSGNLQKNWEHTSALKLKMIELLNKKCTNFVINAEHAPTSPYVLSVSFEGVKGEVLLHALESHQIYVSTGSACSSKISGNRILSAMGQTQQDINGNIRISFCESNTLEEVEIVADVLASELEKLRRL